MRYMLVFVVVAVLVLSACTNLFGPSPEKMASDLASAIDAVLDKVIEG